MAEAITTISLCSYIELRLIDLKKGGLLEIFLELPFTLIIAESILVDELLSFTKTEIALMRRKMEVASLDGEEMKLVGQTQYESPALSFHDCTAFVLAQRRNGCILLTGDKRLRTKAKSAAIKCHGVLWAVEKIAAAKLTTNNSLIKTLTAWDNDSSVWLPKKKDKCFDHKTQKITSSDIHL